MLLVVAASTVSYAHEFKVITVVESIVPGGLGRSRMVENKGELDINAFTSERTDGKKSDQKGRKKRRR